MRVLDELATVGTWSERYGEKGSDLPGQKSPAEPVIHLWTLAE